MTGEKQLAEPDFTGQTKFICVRRNLWDYADLSAECKSRQYIEFIEKNLAFFPVIWKE
jgi:hypothetical protein